MYRLPKEVKLGQGYIVHIIPATPQQIKKGLPTDRVGDAAGYWEPESHSIYIDSTLDVPRQWTVYWHEMIHAVNDIAVLSKGGL